MKTTQPTAKDSSYENIQVGKGAPSLTAPAAKVARGKSSEYASANSIRTGLTAPDIKQAFVENLLFGMGRAPAAAGGGGIVERLRSIARWTAGRLRARVGQTE